MGAYSRGGTYIHSYLKSLGYLTFMTCNYSVYPLQIANCKPEIDKSTRQINAQWC